jgi:hypothetical protein
LYLPGEGEVDLLPDEVVLYIGKTDRCPGGKLDEYYGIELGTTRPHTGGWYLKTLPADMCVDVLGDYLIS